MRHVVRTSLLCAATAMATLGLAACASSIDRTSEIRRQHLEVGKASKDDVVHAIGLPRQVVVDPATGQERWFYVGEADYFAAFVPVPTYIGSNFATALVIPVATSQAPKDATFVAVFDKSARLVDIQHPQPPAKSQ